MKLDLSYVDMQMDAQLPLEPSEPDDYLLKYCITATYPVDIDNLENDGKITVAFAHVVLLDSNGDRDTSLRDACDAYAQETIELYETIFDPDDVLSRPPLDSVIVDDVWYLERLAIEPEYQNQGLGAAIVEWIVKYLCRDRGIVILKPSPLKVNSLKSGRIDIEPIEDAPELKKKLIRFYEKQGFFPLWTTSYMYRVVEWEKGVPEV